jgi:predicted GNAT family acetyltransferase
MVDVSKLEVVNNEAHKQFEIGLDGGDTARIAYIRAGQNIVFTHTEVPEAYEGQGIGSKLARAALDFAQAEGLTVQPLCPYVAAYIRRHPEYQPITLGYAAHRAKQQQADD